MRESVNCRECRDDIVERARSGAKLTHSLASHVELCPACEELWARECALTESLGRLRGALGAERSPASRRAALLSEFARTRRSAPWYSHAEWASGLAAAVVLGLGLWILHSSPAPRVATAAGAAVELAADQTSDQDGDIDAEEISRENGFEAVPYRAPLATGESVKVVRTELYAAALDRMGFAAAVSDEVLPVDIVYGQDGLPRAVRVLADGQY